MPSQPAPPAGDPAITTVVYDLGQVLIGWDPNRVWSRTMSPEQIAEFTETIDFRALNHTLDAGRPFADAHAHVAAAWPAHALPLRQYWDAFADSLTGPIPGSAELVADLHAAGIRLLGLTNWSAETFHHARVAAPALGYLESILVSGEEGLAKPDPAIFSLLIERYRLVPAETVFIDDSVANVEAAAAIGLRTVRFTTTARLRADLARLGLPVDTPSDDPSASSGQRP